MHGSGTSTLDAFNLARVVGELEDVLGKRFGASELGVDRFVPPVAEGGRHVDPFKEVGAPVPAILRKRALKDDIDPGAHCPLGRRGGFVNWQRCEVDDVPSGVSKRREVRRLVLEALLGNQLGVLAAGVGTLDLPCRDGEFKGRDVSAGKVRRQVAR